MSSCPYSRVYRILFHLVYVGLWKIFPGNGYNRIRLTEILVMFPLLPLGYLTGQAAGVAVQTFSSLTGMPTIFALLVVLAITWDHVSGRLRTGKGQPTNPASTSQSDAANTQWKKVGSQKTTLDESSLYFIGSSEPMQCDG